MSVSYDYDAASALEADKIADRIDTSALYIGKFTKVEAIVSPNTGTEGLRFAFESADGKAEFDLYTRRDDGTPVFGMNLLNSMMFILKTKGLNSVPGKVRAYVEGKWEEVDGEVFPDLCEKRIGVVLQKELTTGKKSDNFRMNLVLVCDPVTQLTSSEIKEGGTADTAKKVKRVLRSLKDKDSRKARSTDPAHVSGIPDGEY